MQRTPTPEGRTRAVPLTDLEGPTAELVRQLHAQGGPVMLTHDGAPLAVLVSPEAFDTL